MTRYPHPPIPEPQASVIAEAGAPALNLYRVLGLHPRMLDAWLAFFYALRGQCSTARSLRELMILRTAFAYSNAYEWTQHARMARAAGVSEAQIDDIPRWHYSDKFSAKERAGLLLTDAVIEGRLGDHIHELCREIFSDAEMIELILTASAYCMVPRVLNALALTTEGEEDAECERATLSFFHQMGESEG